jgi:hypothetical protein
MTNTNQNQTGAGTALLICKNKMTDVLEFSKLKPCASMFPTYDSGPITTAYLMNDDSVVGYCAQTREWLKWNAKGELYTSFARTRTGAAKLMGQVVASTKKSRKVEITPADEGFAAARAENAERLRFHGRYINLAALTDDARTVSCQVWCNNQEQVDGAFDKLQSWATPAEEKWHGRIITATAFDGHTKELRTFVRINETSTIFTNAMVEVDLSTAHLIAK